MNYLELAFPQGLFANGTVYQNKEVWYDADRIRWKEGVIRQIGGWRQFTTALGTTLNTLIPDPSVEVARNTLAWQRNDGQDVFAAGTNLKLYAWDRASVDIYDITPVGFTPRAISADVSDGYGNWFYGLDTYGTQRPFEADDSVFSWCFRNWGQNLIAAERVIPSRLYEWEPVASSTPAEEITGTNVPIDFDCFHITPQRIGMCAGQPDDPRLIQWSDIEDLRDWGIKVDNYAGFYRVEGKGRFREIVSVSDQILLISDTDAYVATYRGAPLIYGFDLVANDCGLVSPNACVVTNEFAIWPGKRDFFRFDGTLTRLKCNIMDRVTQAFDGPYRKKTVGFLNPTWSECWWLYQSTEGDEVDSYIVYDYVEDFWFSGTLQRTTGNTYFTSDTLIMIGRDGNVYEHDLRSSIPYDDDPKEIFLESGIMQAANGEQVLYVNYIQPDFVIDGSVDIYLYGRDRPDGPEITFGPYRVDFRSAKDQPVPCRARGTTIRTRIEHVEGRWGLGNMRLNVVGVGGNR